MWRDAQNAPQWVPNVCIWNILINTRVSSANRTECNERFNNDVYMRNNFNFDIATTLVAREYTRFVRAIC